jgi:hypothetical protein
MEVGVIGASSRRCSTRTGSPERGRRAYTTVDELARVLRLRQPSRRRARRCSGARHELRRDRPEIGTSWPTADEATWPEAPDAPDVAAGALIAEVNLERAVEHWQQQESPFGVIGLGESVPTVTAKDSWDRHANKLAPMKRSWGIA